MMKIGLEHVPVKLETLRYSADTVWSRPEVADTKVTPTNTSSASSTSSRAANLENEIESCGNVFILNRRKLFLICGFCDSKYANIVEFAKHVRHGHKLLADSADDIVTHGGSSVPWEAADSDLESTSGTTGLIVKGGFLIRFVSESASSETNQTPPPPASLDENLLKHVPIKLEDETDDDVTMVDETSSNFEDNIESCGNIYMVNRKKLFLICGFCEGKYRQMEQLAAHLHECHTVFQEDQSSESEVTPKESENIVDDLIIKQEPEEVVQPKKSVEKNNENAPPMVAIPSGLNVVSGDVPHEQTLPVVAIPAATRLKKALRESKNTTPEKKALPAKPPVKSRQKKLLEEKQQEPSQKETAKDKPCKKETHPAPEFTCKECDKTFLKQFRLIEHIRVHTGEKPFKCEECGKCFRIKLRMTEHQLRHRSEKAFICEICGLGLATRQDYTLHQRHHKGDKRYVCEQCGKAFVRSSDLKIHIRIHSGERPFKCEVCNIYFRANQNLIIHRRVHLGDKQFKCDYCDKRFFRKIDKRVHHRTHTGEKAFKCEICGRGYSAKVHVRRHLQKRHLDQVQQQSSEDTTPKDDGKKKKKKKKDNTKASKNLSKSFKCEQCPKSYSSKLTLRRHIKKVHTDPAFHEINVLVEHQDDDRTNTPAEEQSPLQLPVLDTLEPSSGETSYNALPPAQPLEVDHQDTAERSDLKTEPIPI